MNNHDKSAERPPIEVDEVRVSMKVDGRTVSLERETGKEKRKLTCRIDDCKGCGLCFKACPVEAIELGPQGVILKGLSEAPHIVISPEKCSLCGICSSVCIFDAIDVEIDGKSIKEIPDYNRYERQYSFDPKKCKPKDKELCRDCEDACPRDAIKAKLEGGKNSIERNAGQCIFCSACEKACPKDAIKVGKIFEGTIEVDLEKCQGCGVCFEICPSNAITLPKPEKPGDKPDKIEIDEGICAFCGACEIACPVNAIKVKRKKANYIRSEGKSWTKTWDKAFLDMTRNEEVE